MPEAMWPDCATGWEADGKIRSRFRKKLPWLQWPIVSREDIGDDHSPSTKALELNSGAMIVMLRCYGTEFIDVDGLQKQVHMPTLQQLLSKTG